jgi:putative lipoic acid-binding regulatory protein
MQVQCPCGFFLKHTGDPHPNFADALPDVLSDTFFDAVDTAITRHDASVATQYVSIAVADLFRQVCQCPSCGRIFIEDNHYQTHEFVPASTTVPKDLFNRRDTTYTLPEPRK